MTYAEMIAANDPSHTLYTYRENGTLMGIGTRSEIDRTIKELSIDTATMRFERA